MLDFDAWLGLNELDNAGEIRLRANDAWVRIQQRPSSVVLLRGNPATAQAAQTMRVEHDSTLTESEGGGGKSSSQRVYLFGVKGHRTVADTNIQRGYRFALGATQYRVVTVMDQIGEVQAIAEAQT